MIKNQYRLTEEERIEKTFFLAQKLFVTWDAYNLSEVLEAVDTKGKSIIEKTLLDLKSLEYESLELGDRVEIRNNKIGKVIESWKYNDGSISEYIIELEGGLGTASIGLGRYVRLVSRYKAEQDGAEYKEEPMH